MISHYQGKASNLQRTGIQQDKAREYLALAEHHRVAKEDMLTVAIQRLGHLLEMYQEFVTAVGELGLLFPTEEMSNLVRVSLEQLHKLTQDRFARLGLGGGVPRLAKTVSFILSVRRGLLADDD